MSQQVFQAAPPSDQPVTSRQTPVRKQGFNVYTAMLLFSLICLITGTILMFSELQRFGSAFEFPWRTDLATPVQQQ